MSNIQYKFRPAYKAEIEKIVNEHISIDVTPKFPMSDLDIMEIGVKKDIDRDYTYDIIPPEIEGGILYQPMHRVPQGTSIKLTIHKPLTVYFIFHNGCDGGYTKTFKNMDEWELCESAPKYDINCTWDPEHGLHQTMYKLKAKVGEYNLPIGVMGVKTNWACWNFVLLKENGEKFEISRY